MAETGEGREHEPGGGRDIEEALRLYRLSAAGDYEPAQRAASDVALNKAVWVCALSPPPNLACKPHTVAVFFLLVFSC
jgi:hypothetical protein